MAVYRSHFFIIVILLLTIKLLGQTNTYRWDFTGDFIWDTEHVLLMEDNTFKVGSIITDSVLREMTDDIKRLSYEYKKLDSLKTAGARTEVLNSLSTLYAEIEEKKRIEKIILILRHYPTSPVFFLERNPNGIYKVSALNDIEGVSKIMKRSDVHDIAQNITSDNVKEDVYNLSSYLLRKSKYKKTGYGFLVGGSSLLVVNSLLSSNFKMNNPNTVRASNIIGLTSLLTGSIVLLSAEVKFSNSLIDIQLRANALKFSF